MERVVTDAGVGVGGGSPGGNGGGGSGSGHGVVVGGGDGAGPVCSAQGFDIMLLSEKEFEDQLGKFLDEHVGGVFGRGLIGFFGGCCRKLRRRLYRLMISLRASLSFERRRRRRRLRVWGWEPEMEICFFGFFGFFSFLFSDAPLACGSGTEQSGTVCYAMHVLYLQC